MKEIFGQLGTYDEAPWAKAPKAYQNIVHEDENVIVYKDGFPVTEGHLLFVPKKRERQSDITRCFELAYKWGVRGVCDYKWEAFNIGINNGVEAGQTVMWPHVHLIPRRKGDLGWFENGTPYDPKGGVRNIIPHKGHYSDTTEGDWENEGGMTLPDVDDNTSREELDSWTMTTARATSKGIDAKETRVVMGVCFGERDDTTEGEKDFDYSAIQYHGKTKNYKKQEPENET